jgi:hypothetical protein
MMKPIFAILILAFAFESATAVQPMRKPRVVITIDGKDYNSGDLVRVKPGQKFTVQTEIEGGRRDYCNFPDIYADVVGKAEILSRGKDGMSYQMDGKKYDWKLLRENTKFESEDFLQLNPLPHGKSAEITVKSGKFSQTFLNLSTIAEWQFSHDGVVSEETNRAGATIYIQLAGGSDVWFKTKNIEVSGIQNNLVQEKLNLVQASCDSIEQNFYRLKFSAVQQDIRNLQAAVNNLKSTIDGVKSQNPAYQVKILFVGLPSDEPYKNLGVISKAKEVWTSTEPLLSDLKLQAGKLPPAPTPEARNELVKIIQKYNDSQSRLTANTFSVLLRFIPELKVDDIRLPESLNISGKEKASFDYAQTLQTFSAFLDKRIQLTQDEIQKINSIHSRLQAITLFDQMLRSYFSSITWAEWQSTRDL